MNGRGPRAEVECRPVRHPADTGRGTSEVSQAAAKRGMATSRSGAVPPAGGASGVSEREVSTRPQIRGLNGAARAAAGASRERGLEARDEPKATQSPGCPLLVV